jgi:hypothetical protein
MDDTNFQRALLEQLRNGELSYQDASIYTVLFDLVDNEGIEEIFSILHNVATDLKQRNRMEVKFEEAKGWDW